VTIVNEIIYICDNLNHRIQLFSLLTGQFISSFPVKDKPWGIINVNQSLFITQYDYDNPYLHEYDMESQKLKQSWKCKSQPDGLRYDNDLIFIAEGGDKDHCIEIFSLSLRKFIDQIGSKQGSEPNQFNYPDDVVVDGNYLYISDCWNHRISVWTVKGEFVKCIGGKFGSEDGELDDPRGLLMKDNQLCIVDCGNRRVQVFK